MIGMMKIIVLLNLYAFSVSLKEDSLLCPNSRSAGWRLRTKSRTASWEGWTRVWMSSSPRRSPRWTSQYAFICRFTVRNMLIMSLHMGLDGNLEADSWWCLTFSLFGAQINVQTFFIVLVSTVCQYNDTCPRPQKYRFKEVFYTVHRFRRYE